MLELSGEASSEQRVMMEKVLYELARKYNKNALIEKEKSGANSNEQFVYSLQSIVFSAFLLESFVNFYGSQIFENWQDYDQERPSLVDKWSRLLKFVIVQKEKSLNIQKLISDIKFISNKRNYIAHHKESFNEGTKAGKGYISSARAKINSNISKDCFNKTQIVLETFFSACDEDLPVWLSQV